MLQTTAAEQLHRSTEHCYRACYDTTSVPCSEKALLQSMLHSSTPMRFSAPKMHLYRACYIALLVTCSCLTSEKQAEKEVSVHTRP